MSNRRTGTEFLLLGFSDTQELQIFHFMVFLGIYLAAMVGNILVIVVIAVSNHLHTSMYFLMNLSVLDLSTVSVTLPNPWPIFSIAWLSCIPYPALRIANTFHLSFCKSNIIDQFGCEAPQLLKLSCSHSYFSEVAVLTFSFLFVVICFAFISMSYIQILTMVLRTPVKETQSKAFSACIPRLIVLSSFVSTGSFACLKPVSNCPSALGFTASLLYSVLTPVIKPVIYTMRNNDSKAAM
ncbi:PREDICTED: olfactory receptor 14J1-like [Leptosomus discolor]|uniref:olfactory receptor 14J1-like n=1 Tax=Leptosomus discolor TaxID=188344 RepID=UPI000522CCEA|nr:PREDICTED: olfactory receptor 14J1-like [Leptosomus discolor]